MDLHHVWMSLPVVLEGFVAPSLGHFQQIGWINSKRMKAAPFSLVRQITLMTEKDVFNPAVFFVHRINLTGPRSHSPGVCFSLKAHSLSPPFSLFFFLKLAVAVGTLCHWMVQLIYSNQFLLFTLRSPPSPAEGKNVSHSNLMHGQSPPPQSGN